MNTQVDPSNVRAGEHAPVPTDRDGLLIEALRTINRMSAVLNEITAWMHSEQEAREDRTKENPSLDVLEGLLLRRFSDASGVHVFIAASNLGIPLPPDIDGSDTDDGTED